jgi:hypothetical protein
MTKRLEGIKDNKMSHDAEKYTEQNYGGIVEFLIAKRLSILS